MSGHKIASITISQEEYRRLYELEKSVQYEAESFPKIEEPEAIQALAKSVITGHIQNQNQYIEMVSQVDDQIAEIESRVIAHNLNLEETYVSALIQNEAQINNRIALIDEKMDQSLSQVDQRIDELCVKVDANGEMIEALLNRGQTYEAAFYSLMDLISGCSNFIQEQFPIHLYDVNELSTSIRKAHIAESNWEEGLFEAAISQAQNIFIDLDSLRMKTSHRHMEWVIRYNQLVYQVRGLGEELAQSATIRPIDSNGIILDEEINLDYWSRGEYGDICKKFNQLVELVNSNEMDLSTELMNQDIFPTLRELKFALSETITQARINVISSQNRYELANRILTALIEQGYVPVSGNYKQGEYLNGYSASVRSHDGSEISVIIDPEELSPLQNKLHVLSSDAGRISDHELKKRAEEIRQSIDGANFQVSPLVQTLEVKPPVTVNRRLSHH